MVLTGNWKEGQFFAYVPVGAFNIGSIHLRDDPYLRTNQLEHDGEVWYRKRDDFDEHCGFHGFDRSRRSKCDERTECGRMASTNNVRAFKKGQELQYEKGEEIGHFSFGSTVAVLFEAP